MAAAANPMPERPAGMAAKIESAVPPQAKDGSGLRAVALAAACGCLAVGSAGVFAWQTGTARLLTWHAGYTALHYNTAVLLMLSGAALAAVLANRRSVGSALAFVVAVFAGAIVGNEFFAMHWGLNDLLFPVRCVVTVGGTRVAPNTGVALLAVGLGLLLAAARGGGAWRGTAAAGLGAVVTIISSAALVGYGFAIHAAYRWREYTAMSLPAAAGITFLGIGVVAAARLEMRREGTRGLQSLPVALAIALATSSLLAWQALDWQRDKAEPGSLLPEIILALTLAISALAVLAVWLAQLARQRSRDLLRSTRAVQASEERYRSLVAATAQLVWNTDAQGVVRGEMPLWTEFTGQTPEQYQGWGWLETVHPEDRARTRQVWRRATTTRGRYEIEYRMRRHDGEYRDMWVRGVPVLNQDGSVREWVGTCTDITERNRAAAELSRAQQTAHVGSWQLSPDYRQVLWSGEVHHIFGTDPSQPPPSYAMQSRMFTAESFARLDEALRSARENNSGYEVDLEFLRPGGERRWIVSRGEPEVDGAGRLLRFHGTVQDITQRKLAEGKLQQYAAELERSNAELQDFAAIASHDLQEPLRKVLAFGDRLRESCAASLDDTGQDCLRRMQNATGRMSQLIESLLQYSRVTSRTQPFQRVDLTTLLFGLIADLEERIKASGARIRCDVLPVVTADPVQMRQLFQNLLANALKFQPPGQQPEIDISAHPLPAAVSRPAGEELPIADRGTPAAAGDRRVPPGGWEIHIRDNGIGFDEVFIDRIFRPFQRLHGRQGYEGSGMGLAICRKIVQRHGGTLTAQSQLGAGSEFVVTLPGASKEALGRELKAPSPELIAQS